MLNNDWEIGFEFEFCHEESKKVLQKDLERVIGTLGWCTKKSREKMDKQTRRKYDPGFYPKRSFTIYQDNTIDTDYGDQEPWELVTPVWDLEDGKIYFHYILRWLDEVGATTNNTTGLHFNLSNYKIMPKLNDNFNRERLVRLIDEEKYLKMFKRSNNIFVRPHVIGNFIECSERDRAISFRRKRYVEFRFVGGKNYHLKGDKIWGIIEDCGHKMELSVN